MYESELIIAVRNGNGKIIASQTFEEFMNGRKNIVKIFLTAAEPACAKHENILALERFQ